MVEAPRLWSKLGEHYRNHWRGYVVRLAELGLIDLVPLEVVDQPIAGQLTIDA
jgi:hypothetical protein